MWYAIISEDHEGTLDQRLTARPEHVARLTALRDEGRLLIAGPHPAVEDPYIAAGVYSNVTVKPFNLVLP